MTKTSYCVRCVVLLTLAVVLTRPAMGQVKTSKVSQELAGFGKEETLVYIPVGKKPKLHALETRTCSTIPTSPTRTFNGSYTLDTDAAGKLSVNYIGTGSVAVDQTMRVFVREYSKLATCDATDGTGTLVYGAWWRATVLVKTTDVQANLSFAVVAASATLNNQTTQVLIEHQGFVNQQQIDTADQVAMKDAANGLTVVTYAKFADDIENAANAVVASSTVTPLPFAGTTSTVMHELGKTIASAFALTYIAQGRGCLDAIGDLKDKSADAGLTIRATYRMLTNTDCDASDQIAQVTAKRILNGIEIKQK